MMALETINAPYLSDDTTLLVSPDTATRVDKEVLRIIKTCYEKALVILKENEDKLHEIADHLFEKETMTGEEFVKIFNDK